MPDKGRGRLSPLSRPAFLRLAVPVAGLLIFFALALNAAIAKTPTADEGMHLLRGRVLWETAEFDLQGQHTPLSHWLIGSLFFSDPDSPDVQQLPSWSIRWPDRLVQELLWRSGADVGRLLLLGRLPVIFVALLLGALLARWAFQLGGAPALGIVTTLYAFSPNLLASAALATTDLVAAAAFTAAVYTSWYFWQQPSFWRWLLAGLAIGLAISSKLTGLLILPVALILAYALGRDGKWWRPGALWLSMLPVAGLVLWAAYGFELGGVAWAPFPFPAATFFGNFVEVQQHLDRGHYAYLLGERSNEGWWGYFVVASLVKTPAIVLLLFVVAVVYLTWQKKWRSVLFLWFPALALFVAASYSRLNIGYRHVLAIVPLVWLLMAMSAPFWLKRRWLLALLFLALALYAVGSLRQRPHYLAYFNELIGGPSQGYRYLGDSNLDWGQDLRLLADYVGSAGADPVYASYFGIGDPSYYGLDIEPLFDEEGRPVGFSPANPAPGRYAISANHLQGTTEIEPDLFGWFRGREPIDQLGYSILVFDVPQSLEGAWLGQCFDPEPLVERGEAGQLIGRENLRHFFFDCRTTWVLPAGGEPGWYLLPADVSPPSISGAIGDRLERVYSNALSPGTPAYDVYYWPGTHGASEQLTALSEPVTLADGSPLAPPVAAGDVAHFIGGWVDGSLWASGWQAASVTEIPLSLLMHLYSDDPLPTVADGLGFSPAQWEPGDIFIQFHDFGTVSARFLETGLYDYTTGERLPLEIGDAEATTVQIHAR
jgi:hypothetical protein